MRIDLSTDHEVTAHELRGQRLAPLSDTKPLAEYDFAFIVHETAEGDINLATLIRSLRKARQVFFIHHAGDYAAFPCKLREALSQKMMLGLRRRFREVGFRLACRRTTTGTPIAPELIAANESKLDWITSLSAEQLDTRFGDRFREYFAGEGSSNRQGSLSFRSQAVQVAMAQTLVNTPANGRVLDLGCGYGIHSLMLREAGNRVVGLDLLEERARLVSRHGHANLSGISGVGEHLPFADGSFDLIFAHDSIQHVCDIGATFAECRRVLRPGGVLVVSEVHPYNPDLFAAYGPWAPMRLGCRQLYADQRAEYLRRSPSISDDEAIRTARRTESFTTAELDALVAARLSSQVEQSLRRLQAARGELTATRSIEGWCEERYLRPTQIKRRLARAGFPASGMRSACLAHDGGPTARIVFAGPFTDLLFPRYMVVATK